MSEPTDIANYIPMSAVLVTQTRHAEWPFSPVYLVYFYILTQLTTPFGRLQFSFLTSSGVPIVLTVIQRVKYSRRQCSKDYKRRDEVTNALKRKPWLFAQTLNKFSYQPQPRQSTRPNDYPRILLLLTPNTVKNQWV